MSPAVFKLNSLNLEVQYDFQNPLTALSEMNFTASCRSHQYEVEQLAVKVIESFHCCALRLLPAASTLLVRKQADLHSWEKSWKKKK